MAGDVETGVTIHRTVKELDAGPIAAQGSFLIEADDDAGEVYARAAELAVDLLDDVLASAEPGLRPQPEDGVTYADKIACRRSPPRPLATAARARRHRPRALAAHRRAGRAPRQAGDDLARAGAGRTARSSRSRCSPAGGRRMEYDAWLRGLR